MTFLPSVRRPINVQRRTFPPKNSECSEVSPTKRGALAGGLAAERFAGSPQQDNRHGITLGMATRPSRSRGCRECNGGADGGHGDRDDTLGEAKAVRRQRLSPQGNLKEPNERTFSPVRVGGQPTHPEY